MTAFRFTLGIPVDNHGKNRASFKVGPILDGLFLGYVPGMLLLAQAGFSGACVLVVMYSNPK